MTGALLAALAVVSGAFGAHGLKNLVDDRALAYWDTASRYHILHAMALVLYGMLRQRTSNSTGTGRTGQFFLLGILFFSGSLYLLALRAVLPFEVAWLGPITPIGGLLLIAGWISMAMEARGAKEKN